MTGSFTLFVFWMERALTHCVRGIPANTAAIDKWKFVGIIRSVQRSNVGTAIKCVLRFPSKI
jgi:hypothetical protein